MSDEYTNQESLLRDVNLLRRKIEAMQKKFDDKISTTHGAALALQEARGRLKELLSKLRPPTLIWVHPNPESLSEAA